MLVQPVDRWISGPRSQLAQTLRSGAFAPGSRFDVGGAELRLDGSFEASVLGGRLRWRAPARLVAKGPTAVRFTRVDVEVLAWADDLAEVSLRSRGRHVLTWGERRERRYFDHAHRAAATIAARLAPPAASLAA